MDFGVLRPAKGQSRMPLCLTDTQLQTVLSAAADLPQEKRGLFLQRLSSMINMHGRRFTDDDLIEITKLARTGLAREPAA
jgi:hypothetical protein